MSGWFEIFSAVHGFGRLAVESAWEHIPDRESVRNSFSAIHLAVKKALGVGNTRESESVSRLEMLKLRGRGINRQARFCIKQLGEDVSETLETLRHSPQTQGIFNSVADLSGALLVHEAAGFGLDLLGLSLLADLARTRGRLGFGVRGFLLLKLVPPYFSKAERQEKIRQEESEDAVMVDPADRSMPGVKIRAFRDFCNLNTLHVIALLIFAYQVGKMSANYLDPTSHVCVQFLANSYVQGHFLWQYPLARDQWGAASTVYRLASRPEIVLLLGIASEAMNQLFLGTLPVFMAMPASLLWALSLTLLAYHLRGPFTVNLKEHELTPKFYDPGLALWKTINLVVDLLIWIFRPKNPAVSPGMIWGSRFGEFLNFSGLRELDFAVAEKAVQGPYGNLIRKILGFRDVGSLVTRHTAFMVNDYGEALGHCRDVVLAHQSKIEFSKRVLKSSGFHYVGRPLLLLAYGSQGSLGRILIASDFVLAAFPHLTPAQLERIFGKFSTHLDVPVVQRHVRRPSLDESAYEFLDRPSIPAGGNPAPELASASASDADSEFLAIPKPTGLNAHLAQTTRLKNPTTAPKPKAAQVFALSPSSSGSGAGSGLVGAGGIAAPGSARRPSAGLDLSGIDGAAFSSARS
jgi:hypothetical protein